ncbi:PREDICTED: TCDD-inducible poly [ADP-ribose] polymerase-like [Nanorana parkeri]|uniref:TCDD-inducible poly [ADP-ribose] polymerase-like n=1 Tax=Nanorana parkeri TaxID=125878 RepID=UPI0008541FA4|nr:PREDICTED: TCDD-inducible poly [ADP-ribose] polymerase-like [Nanorana parkeri]
MHQSRAKKRRLSLPDRYPVITGLDPIQEETALQQLEFGSESTFGLVDLPSEVAQHAEGLVTGNNCNIHFIHYNDDIDICSDFLIGRCVQGLLCPRHHTAWPYLWQLKYKASGLWFSIDVGAQLVLERLYSDPAVAQVTGIHLGLNILIDLSTMTVHSSLMFDRIRRLSTSVCPTKEFHTVYIYYYEGEENKWVEYNPDFVKCIEEGLREHQEEVLCAHSRFTYSLHLVNMVQTNLSTNTKRRMRKRPVFKSPIVMVQKLRAFPVCLCPLNPLERPASHPDEDSCYPKTWIISYPKPIYEKSHVSCSAREYTYIYTYFHKTMAESKYIILEVSRIQNYFQWTKYSQKKKFMQSQLKETKDGCLERYLFHGTKSDHIEAIFNQNFDPRVSGKNGTVYGKGCYFAKDASYSHTYSNATPEGHHFMFLAKVLVGHTALGSATYTRPPPLIEDCPSSLLYDSCVDKAKDPTIFIIFDSDQCYPYFMIKYQKMHDLVLLD